MFPNFVAWTLISCAPQEKIEFYIIDYLKLLQEFYNVPAKNLSPLYILLL